MLPLLFGNGAYVWERNDPFIQLLWHPRNVWCTQHQPHDLTNTNPPFPLTAHSWSTTQMQSITWHPPAKRKRSGRGKKRLKRRIHSCTREREREREQLNILFSCFSLPTQTTQCSFTGENGSSPWSWLSGTSWTYRKADIQTHSYQNPFVSWVCKWAILWAYEILAKEDSLNLKLASHFNCLTTFTSGPQIFFSQLRHDSL